MNPLISIIIPVYKVEDYLHRCVDSVLDQNFEDIEIILINDGSPDNCPVICDEYAKRDNRIKVVHSQNKGSSEARNQGAIIAKGKYINFLDSDDYWEGKNCLENIVKTILENNADLVFYGSKDVNLVNGTATISRGNYIISELRKNKDAAVKSLIETNHFPASSWIFLIKRELVTDNNLYFREGEDIDWLVNVFIHAQTFDAVNDTFYMYIKNRPGSITTTAGTQRAQELLYAIKQWKSPLEAKKSQTNLYLLSFLTYHYITAFIIYSKINKSGKKILLPDLRELFDILKYAKGKRARLSKAAINIFGIEAASKLFRNVHFAMNKWPQLKKYI